MKQNTLRPDWVFEVSWEVCNKVGGIYTVLSSRARTLLPDFRDHLVFIGPDLWSEENPAKDFREDRRVLRGAREAAEAAGLRVRTGRWLVEGEPAAVLIDFKPFLYNKYSTYARAWELFGVDSLKAYGDYDEASAFSVAAAEFVKAAMQTSGLRGKRVVYQAHEWMTGLGMMFLKHDVPSVATIFTTHATSIGRSIAGNNKLLYKYFQGYHGDQMASELSMEAKHSVEKQSAHRADCFTTVSTFTDRECRQLLEKGADVVLPNGFDQAFTPVVTPSEARRRLLDVASALTGEVLPEDTFIVSTSGRNDYRCKGFDVYAEALAQLNCRLREEAPDRRVLALIEVPCWVKGPREDLLDNLQRPAEERRALPNPFITHELHNFEEDRIVNTLRSLSLTGGAEQPVKVVLVPCYLDGNDGIVNLEYYDALAANDLCIYPSYYEPWGYTPLEACAYGVPCVTTDLSGFGQWVEEVVGRETRIDDGALVLHRDDDNFFPLASRIADECLHLLLSPLAKQQRAAKAAQKLAEKARWEHFIGHYYEAYDFALRKALNQ